MQYKFFVDGEWRHDEHQPYATSEYGIVNTIFLATAAAAAAAEANYIPGTPSADTPLVWDMEVGDHAWRLVRACAQRQLLFLLASVLWDLIEVNWL